MAFYGFKGDADNCYWTPYSTAYDEFGESEYSYTESHYYSFTSPLELHDSVYTFSEPKISEYYDPYYYGYSVNPPQVDYSSNLKFLQFEPRVYDQGFHFPSETTFRISYSESQQFNEPKFEEYDPTPYDGGYDLAATYGKPLPPSDLVCYPRSLPKSVGTHLENFSYNSIPSPYGKEEEEEGLPKKPPNENKSVDAKPDWDAPVIAEGNAVSADVAESADVSSSDDDTVESSDLIPGEASGQNGLENGMRGDYGYECERRFDQIPYGSGLESIDLCESIFGYWPCLAKIEQQQRAKRQASDQDGGMDPWKSAADYLFGTPTIYGYGNYHHLQQEGYEKSWL